MTTSKAAPGPEPAPDAGSPADADPRLEVAAGLVEGLAADVLALPHRWTARPSRLPGWTKGHVLTHLARLCDGLARLADGAASGTQARMYDSAEHRQADIDRGVGRGAPELAQDLLHGWHRLSRRLEHMPQQARHVPVRLFSGATVPALQLPSVLLTEYRLHLVDLDIGHEPDAWPEAFVQDLYRMALARFGDRADVPATALRCDDQDGDDVIGRGRPELRVVGERRQLVAWLTGRSAGRALERLPHGPLPALPPWA